MTNTKLWFKVHKRSHDINIITNAAARLVFIFIWSDSNAVNQIYVKKKKSIDLNQFYFTLYNIKMPPTSDCTPTVRLTTQNETRTRSSCL